MVAVSVGTAKEGGEWMLEMFWMGSRRHGWNIMNGKTWLSGTWVFVWDLNTCLQYSRIKSIRKIISRRKPRVCYKGRLQEKLAPLIVEKLSIYESCLLMKVVFLWKLSFDGSCLLMKIVYWWKLSIDESFNSQRSDSLWRFACGDVLIWRPLQKEWPLTKRKLYKGFAFYWIARSIVIIITITTITIDTIIAQVDDYKAHLVGAGQT